MRILIADNEPGCRLWLQTLLIQSRHDVMVCQDGVSAWEILQQPDSPKIAILDWMMPGMDGLDVCRAVRGRVGCHYTYLILLSGKTQKEDLILGLQAGADDYLIKPIDEEELQLRLKVGQRILDWQDQLLAAREQLLVLATRDPLTGLLNRRAICDLLERELERGRREGRFLGLAIIDLDHFKQINDIYGHQAGDAVLRMAGQKLSNALRPYDLVGRYGGEEFLVVVPGNDEVNLLKICERLRESLAGSPVEYEGKSIAFTASIGATITSPHSGTNAEAEVLVRMADRALYQAKAQGRNQVVFGTPST